MASCFLRYLCGVLSLSVLVSLNLYVPKVTMEIRQVLSSASKFNFTCILTLSFCLGSSLMLEPSPAVKSWCSPTGTSVSPLGWRFIRRLLDLFEAYLCVFLLTLNYNDSENVVPDSTYSRISLKSSSYIQHSTKST